MKKYLLNFLALLFSTSALAGIKDDFLSPLESQEAKYTLLTGSLLTATTLIFKKDLIEKPQLEYSVSKPMGKYSKYGDLAGQLVPNAVYSLGMLGYGYFAEDSLAYERASGMFKATLYSSILTTVLKYTVREQRPDKSARNSFPSGHTTTAFAFASYVGAEHGYGWGVPAYLMAAAVGFSRINDNKHWVNDVVMGATIGTAYGLGISFINKKEKENKITITPKYTKEEQSINLSYSF